MLKKAVDVLKEEINALKTSQQKEEVDWPPLAPCA